MAHFAEISNNNVVLRIIVVSNDVVLGAMDARNENLGQTFLSTSLGLVGTWKQTSYSASFRKNFAGIGFTYDATRDAFIPPKPYPSWLLDERTCRWHAPVMQPCIASVWNESTLSWMLI